MDRSAVASTLRLAALAFPEVTETFPWGESAFKVRGKVFLFLNESQDDLVFSLKLPHRHLLAAELPGCSPTGYGLGKSGWITVRINAQADFALDQLLDWLDESYRAIAPKAVVRQLDGTR